MGVKKSTFSTNVLKYTFQYIVIIFTAEIKNNTDLSRQENPVPERSVISSVLFLFLTAQMF